MPLSSNSQLEVLKSGSRATATAARTVESSSHTEEELASRASAASAMFCEGCPVVRLNEARAHFHTLTEGAMFRCPMKCRRMYAANVSNRIPVTAITIGLLILSPGSALSSTPVLAKAEVINVAQKLSPLVAGALA